MQSEKKKISVPLYSTVLKEGKEGKKKEEEKKEEKNEVSNLPISHNPLFIDINPQNLSNENKNKSTLIKKINRKLKEDKKCFSCKPKGAVKHHIISSSECNNFIYHHDMTHRPIIIVTPRYHVHKITEISPEHQALMFNSIETFCNFWNITDYQVSFNNGAWQTHSHFHIKLKISEKIINRMRRDHFEKLKLENNYKPIENEEESKSFKKKENKYLS